MRNASRKLLELIHTRSALVGVIGLGYVGLPLARVFARTGFRVLGFDTDPLKVGRLQEGGSYLMHVPPGEVQAMRRAAFEATDDLGRLAEPDVLLVCVPTPLDEAWQPDLSHVVASARACAAQLRASQLVVLESTTYPGTTREVVLPILEESGLRAGQDFFLAYSPEREDPGNPRFPTESVPKVVGGIDRASLEIAAAFYSQVFDEVVPVSGAEVAEACKVLENTYRAVNIALVNELKILYGRMGIDVWEVIEAARTKPFGFQPFYPGPGWGGHCIPVDPFYLAWLARRYGLPARFIELAGEVNTTMPHYILGKLADALTARGKDLRESEVILLGMAYKPDVDDCRESPGLALMDLLQKEGAVVRYHDPHIPKLPPARRYPHLRAMSHPLTAEFLAAQDAVVVVTDHSAYDWNWVVEHARLVVDTRNATQHVVRRREKILMA